MLLLLPSLFGCQKLYRNRPATIGPRDPAQAAVGEEHVPHQTLYLGSCGLFSLGKLRFSESTMLCSKATQPFRCWCCVTTR
jgi:hypothetical protein